MRVESTVTRMTVRRTGDDVVIELGGEFDTVGRLRFREQIGELLGRGGGLVTVDVGDLAAVDIAGLAALLRAELLLRRVHTELRIRAASPAFSELVRETGLSGRLRVEEAGRRRGY
ncbi:STAS domain-containing protein [Parafrankia sp. FMc2]|uniref:STAS domain-containing protein n=1 Tax=Parafrankia sp. FMc2 TaxID=3233196 RepID=UPI0034D6E72B